MNLLQLLHKITLNKIILFFAIILFCSSCSNDKTLKDHIDLIPQITGQLELPTGSIDFRIRKNAAHFLMNGWRHQEHNFNQMKKKEAAFLFYTYTKNKYLNASISLTPIQTEYPATIGFSVNGMHFDSIQITNNQSQQLPLKIPSKLLVSGINSFEIQNNTSKPKLTQKDTLPAKANTSFISLEEIIFHNNSSLKLPAENNILQQGDSEFHFYSDLPPQFNLEVKYNSTKNTNSALAVSNESGEKYTIQLDPKDNKVSTNLIFNHQGILKFSFITKGPITSSTTWKLVKITTENVAPSPASPKKIAEINHQPDIFIYIVDTLRVDHLQCYGYSRNTSPNIDKFTKDATLFTNAYSNASWTKSSGASILTGLFPKHHTAITRRDKLPDEIVTLAEILKKNGYTTSAFIGNGNLTETFGFNQGFDTFIDLSDNKEEPELVSYLSDHINKYVFNFLNEFLSTNERKPLFMLIWTIDPHAPYAPRDTVKNMFDIDQFSPVDTYDVELFKKIKRQKITLSKSQIEFMKTRYDQEIFFNDKSFGAFVEKLKETSLYENSMTIFSSDHGEEFFDHGYIGHGRTLYNEQIRMPLIIKGANFESGAKNNSRVQHIDLFPTILDALEIKSPSDLDGISIFANHSQTRPLFFEQNLDDVDITAIISRKKKLIYNKRMNKFIGTTPEQIEVFDESDKHEKVNLRLRHNLDKLLSQDVLVYRKTSAKKFQRSKATIPKGLDERLKALGYLR